MERNIVADEPRRETIFIIAHPRHGGGAATTLATWGCCSMACMHGSQCFLRAVSQVGPLLCRGWGAVLPVGGQFYLYGGLQKSKRVGPGVFTFDPYLECWCVGSSNGTPPSPKLYGGASASLGHHLYIYGGLHGPAGSYQDSLYQLDTATLTFMELGNTSTGLGQPPMECQPMRKMECGMVSHGGSLVLFGGYGIPTGPIQADAGFVRNREVSANVEGWSNELHSFDLKQGMKES